VFNTAQSSAGASVDTPKTKTNLSTIAAGATIEATVGNNVGTVSAINTGLTVDTTAAASEVMSSVQSAQMTKYFADFINYCVKYDFSRHNYFGASYSLSGCVPMFADYVSSNVAFFASILFSPTQLSRFEVKALFFHSIAIISWHY
jgi:hypothetical protein